MQVGHLIISILDINSFCFRIINLGNIFFILFGNSKLIRTIIKFSEKLHTILNELSNRLPTFLFLRE